MNNTCTVTNKSGGVVMYSVPEMNIQRNFHAKEVKKNIPVAELEALANQPGGSELIYNSLYIDDPTTLRMLINKEESPEYWLTEDMIPGWMETCSLDEFKDALDFAPEGTIDLIKEYALSLPLNDYSKRQAIKEQIGFDITKALDLTQNSEPAAVAAPARRASAPSITVPTPVKVVIGASN